MDKQIDRLVLYCAGFPDHRIVDGGTILEDKQTPLRRLLKHHLLPLWRRLHEAVITGLITVQSYVGLEDLYCLFP